MKSKLYLALLVTPILALLAIGCGGEGEKTEIPSNEKIEETTEDAGAPVDEMVEETKNEFESLKEEYIKKAEKLMSSWDDKLSSLEEKKNSLPGITSKPLEEPYKAVMNSKTELDHKFSDLKDAGEDTFNEKKNAFEGSLEELTSGYGNLLGMF